VGDTNDVDREHFEIGIDRASGERWMWAVIVLLGALATLGARALTTSTPE
jgi:hypothetical protein